MAWEKAIRDIVIHDHKFRRAITRNGTLKKPDRGFYARGETPQGEGLPVVVYQELGEAGETQHQQGSGGLAATDVLVLALAEDYSEAAELVKTVRQALVGQRGTFDGETLQGVFLSGRRTEKEVPADRGEQQLQSAELILTIWHEEA
jgi:hypothetical protein